MAGVRFKAATSLVATGTSLKTIAQLVAASNHGIKLDEIEVSFAGTSNTATPIKVEVLRQTTAGTMSSLTPVKDPDDSDETLQVTAQHTATAEPTASDILIVVNVHPQTGWSWQAPFGREIKIGGGDRVGVRVTAAADVNCAVRFCGEE